MRIVPILFYNITRCSGSPTAINLIEIIKEFRRKISRKISRIKIRIIPIIFLKLFSENNPSIFYKIKWILLNRIDLILNLIDIKNWITRWLCSFTTTGSHRDDTSWIQEIISLKLRKGPQDIFQKNIWIIFEEKI